MFSEQKLNERLRYVIEISIRAGFLILLILWCLSLLTPFASLILWAIILAIAAEPIYNFFFRITGSSRKWGATLFIISGLAVILVPAWIFLESTITSVKHLLEAIEAGTLTVPPPGENVREWPLIGERVYNLWSQASVNFEGFLETYSEQIRTFSLGLLGTMTDIVKSILAFVASTIIAGILLVTRGTSQFSEKFFRRLMGSNGSTYLSMISMTIRNVTKGVIGVAFIQAFLIGIGLLLAGVPYFGVWTLLTFVLVLLQLPAIIIIIPVSAYLFSAEPALTATLWTIYLLLAGLSDNVLKPILLGKGAPVPMLVIFLGVIGGFIFSGFIGLFTGAIVLSIGYKLFITWVDSTPVPEDSESAAHDG